VKGNDKEELNMDENEKIVAEVFAEKDKEIDFWKNKSQLPPAGKFRLSQRGAFVAKMQIECRDLNENEVKTCGSPKDLLVGQSREIDPGEFGVPPGSHIRLKVKVVAGKDALADKWFSYEPGAEVVQYEISGTTFHNTLK
jgi:hypothetical protein